MLLLSISDLFSRTLTPLVDIGTGAIFFVGGLIGFMMVRRLYGGVLWPHRHTVSVMSGVSTTTTGWIATLARGGMQDLTLHTSDTTLAPSLVLWACIGLGSMLGLLLGDVGYSLLRARWTGRHTDTADDRL